MTHPCGGCEGKGSHWRWCPAKVGHRAHHYGVMAERAESMADSVGANMPGVANALYGASSELRKHACDLAEEFEEARLDAR